MKKIPWNRFTKHLCVFVALTDIALAHFWKTEILVVLVVLMIPIVHRIEKDYRSKRRQCPQCRRWKCAHEFDVVLCTECFTTNPFLGRRWGTQPVTSSDGKATSPSHRVPALIEPRHA